MKSVRKIIFIKQLSLLLCIAIYSAFIYGCVGDGGKIDALAGSGNNPPTAENQSYTTNEGKALVIILEAGDPDEDMLIYKFASKPLHGSLTGEAPYLLYKPYAEFYGADDFTFYVFDGADDSDTAEVSIHVYPKTNVGPYAPSHLIANPVSGSSIALSWQDNSNDELGFGIERKTELEGEYKVIATIGMDITGYVDAELDSGTYYYQVYALNENANSKYSNEAQETPQADPFFTNFYDLCGPHVVDISFTTKEAVTAKVFFGTQMPPSPLTWVWSEESTGENHTIDISDIPKGETFYYYVHTDDDQPAASHKRTFTTRDYTHVEGGTYADSYVEYLSGENCASAGNDFTVNFMLDDVQGAGNWMGSLDVFSMRNCSPDSQKFVTIKWSGRIVMNGPGIDFVFFENGFKIINEEAFGNYFMEELIIYLSLDGIHWASMPHDYRPDHGDENEYSSNPEDWQGFAGLWPVFFHCVENPIDPFIFDLAGGDHFDLEDIEDTELGAEIRRKGFKYLKMVTAWTEINPDTGNTYPHSPHSFDGAPDCDGVYARYFAQEE